MSSRAMVLALVNSTWHLQQERTLQMDIELGGKSTNRYLSAPHSSMPRSKDGFVYGAIYVPGKGYRIPGMIYECVPGMT